MEIYSDEQKHKLRIAAKLLRKDGRRFANCNFYEAVINEIDRMDIQEREKFMGLVDWIEEYEDAESIYCDAGTLPRGRKNKNQSCNKKQNAAAPAAASRVNDAQN